MTVRAPAAGALPLVLAASVAQAHGDGTAVRLAAADAAAIGWSVDPLLWVLHAAALLMYAGGFGRSWEAASLHRRSLHVRDAACFGAGWTALAIALLSPLHSWGETLFSAHMLQHELLMLVAAPLLVMGRPLAPLAHVLPRRWLVGCVRIARSARLPGRLWRTATTPLAAWSIHAAALWVWHLPALFEATLTSDAVHTLQHASFLGSALLFWWSLLRRRTRPADYGAGVLYLFTTSVQSGALGALLALGGRVLYPSSSSLAPAWGLAPLEDQQLGGLLMWIPGGLIYAGVALLLLLGWIRASEPFVPVPAGPLRVHAGWSDRP